MNELNSFINNLKMLYCTKVPNSNRVPVLVILTDDLNKTHAELRPDIAETVLNYEGLKNDNGRMVLPVSLDDEINVLLNRTKINEYTNDKSMAWVGTFAHEYTHAIDYYQMARTEGLECYLPLENSSQYIMFQLWSEYHARKTGYGFLRRYLELTGQMQHRDEQIEHLLVKEAPEQTQIYIGDYILGSPNERLYLTMQYLGRFSVWIDLFPECFDEYKLLKWGPKWVWMVDLLCWLRTHDTLDNSYDHFDELKVILSENWEFE